VSTQLQLDDDDDDDDGNGNNNNNMRQLVRAVHLSRLSSDLDGIPQLQL
jgi:hypothetical protein